MRLFFKRLNIRKLILVVLVVAVGFVVYWRLRPVAVKTSPLSILPTTPVERDAVREKRLITLREAIDQSSKLHGAYPFVIPKVETGICNGSSVHCKQMKLLDLNVLVSDGFLTAIPNDPSGGKGQYNSGYALRRDSDGSLLLLAPRSEGPTVLSLKL